MTLKSNKYLVVKRQLLTSSTKYDILILGSNTRGHHFGGGCSFLFTEGDFFAPSEFIRKEWCDDVSLCTLLGCMVTYEALFAFAMVLITFAALFISRK